MKRAFMLIVALFAVICSASAQSQSMVIKLKNGKKMRYPITSIEEIKWITINEYSTKPDATPAGVEAVDLGLSVKWANLNLGADAPSAAGDYYAFGETEPKEEYFWDNYKYSNGSFDTLTKYCTNPESGTVDNKDILESDDDVANVKWGGDWRIPTDAEWTELREECSWKWSTQDGVKGYIVYGTNGNSIFLPAAGTNNYDGLVGVGVHGGYWSRSIREIFSYSAYCVRFNMDNIFRVYHNRNRGLSIRAVCP